MQIKLLLTLCLLINAGFITVKHINAQICIPDPQYTAPGIYPDSIKGLDDATVGEYYQQVITVIAPLDTTNPDCDAVGGTIVIDSIVLTGMTGVPPGLLFNCEPPSCSWAGGTSGCILIDGTPANTGSYNVFSYTTTYAYCDWFMGPTYATQDDTIKYYTINVLCDTILLTTSVLDPTTCSGNDGTIDLTVTGGSMPYTFNWSPGGEITEDINGLTAGLYAVVVTDAYGCIDSTGVVLVDPGAPTVSVTDSSMVSCFGGNDGSATVTPIGGTSPYSYQWDDLNAQTDSTATGLIAGTYTVTVIDAGACVSSTAITIIEPSLLTATISFTNESVSGVSDGTAMVTANGGTPSYTYLWSPGAETTDSISGLAPGYYSVTVTDANGCDTVAGDSIFAGPVGIFDPNIGNENIKVYPNPAVNIIYFEIAEENAAKIQIIDIMGKQIKTVHKEGTVTAISTVELYEGLYFYRILNRNEIVVNRGKFNIHR